MAAIVITGPTAVGKSDLGMALAAQLGGEIISVDSRQLYRSMDIGTAKPSRRDMERVSHHFIDIADPSDRYSAGRFGREARVVIESLEERGILPILVGGSGLYLSAVVDGLFEGEADMEMRQQLQRRLATDGGLPSLRDDLLKVDPVAHSALAPNDAQRILRALELCLGAGATPQSARIQDQGDNSLYPAPAIFGLTMGRVELYQRVDQRIDAMISRGWLDEVRELIAAGYDPDCYGLSSLGYWELCQHLTGGLPLEETVNRIKRRSRHYAKRQLTWFRKDRRLRWLDLDRIGGVRGAVKRVLAQIAPDRTRAKAG